MNNKITKIFCILFAIIILFLCFLNYKNLTNFILNSSIIFIKNVFPFLFFSMVINKILLKQNIINYFKNPYDYLFILSIFFGSPSSAVILNDLLEKDIIDIKSASKSLSFCSLCSPLFIINYLNKIFNDNKVIIYILIIYYSINIVFFLHYRRKLNFKKKAIINSYSFNKILVDSINESVINMLYIYGTITFFMCISNLLFENSNIIICFLKGIIEITQGLNCLCLVSKYTFIKKIFAMVILIFTGFSIHMQISLILNKYNINYKYLYISKTIQSLVGILLLCI